MTTEALPDVDKNLDPAVFRLAPSCSSIFKHWSKSIRTFRVLSLQNTHWKFQKKVRLFFQASQNKPTPAKDTSSQIYKDRTTTIMPTNHPFFANFFAAFRAHSAIAKASASNSASTTTTTSSASQFPTSLSSSAARAISTTTANKTAATAGATTAAVQAAHSHISHHARSPPSARSPPASSTYSPTARSPPASSNFHQHRQPQRRGSDSSSDGGFRDALGGEKWYVGGRTAQGEERFYRLGMVRKERSCDRGSLDRLSL